MQMFMYCACFQAAEEQALRNLKRGRVSTDKPEEESHNSGEFLFQSQPNDINRDYSRRG